MSVWAIPARARGPRRWLTSLAGLAILPLHPLPCHAQPGEPFDTVNASLRVSANVNRTRFHDFWEPAAGFELGFDTPFYLGSVEAGIHYNGFTANGPEQPDFRSLFPFFGWGLEAPIGNRLRWYNGLRIGSFLMFFDEVEVNDDEQEMALALNSRARFRVSTTWSIEAGARYREVFTHRRLRHVFLAVGLTRSIASPGWLRELLE